MPRRNASPPVPSPIPEAAPVAPLPEDDFVQSLRSELQRTQKSAGEKDGEDTSHRAALNKRLLQYPEKWTFRDNFDFGAVKTIELHDRTPGWLGHTLRFWYYKTPEGKSHLRGIFEWSDGESYHRYTGWMRMMSQAVLYDSADTAVSLHELHQVLKDVVVHWYSSHIDRTPEAFVAHLKEKYPKGASYAKESYRA